MRYLLNSSHTNAGNDENADPKPKRSMLKMFIMNFVLPGIIFNAVKTRTSLPIAYLISGIPPVLDAGKNVIASKSLDPISALVILSIVGQIIMAVFTSDQHYLNLANIIVPSFLGLCFIGSIFFLPQNLILMYIQRSQGDSPEAQEIKSRQLARPGFIATTKLLSAYWGIGQFVKVGILVLCDFLAPSESWTYILPLVSIGIDVILGVTTFLYIRYRASVTAHLDELKAARARGNNSAELQGSDPPGAAASCPEIICSPARANPAQTSPAPQ